MIFRNLYLIILLIFTFLKIINIEALYFILKPDSNECILFNLEKNDHFIGSYEVDSTYEGVKVSLFETGGELVIFDHIKNSGNFSFNALKSTEYQLCFKNLMKSAEQTVSFSVKNMSHSQMNNIMSNHESSKLINSMEKLHEKIILSAEKQKYALVRKKFQMDAIESSRRRATFWSIIELLVSTIFVFIQIYYMKSYFQVKYLI